MRVRNKTAPWKKALARKYRRNMTLPERLLWSRLRGNKTGVRFYPQSVVLGWILDLWCPKFKLCVELDGKCHLSRRAYDNSRDASLAAKGIKTLRIKASDVIASPDAAAALVMAEIIKRGHRSA